MTKLLSIAFKYIQYIPCEKNNILADYET